MIEDKLLILKFKHGSSDALRRIYEKYKVYLLKIAVALLHDASLAEDAVQDAFVRFAQSQNSISINGSLKAYLRTCVINSVHNKNREKQHRNSTELNDSGSITSKSNNPLQWIVCKEESIWINDALERLPYEQREIVVLYLFGDMKFRQIAKLKDVSIRTIQSRYRYGLEKMRSILNGESIKK